MSLSDIEVGERLHAVYKPDGEFYPASVVAVSHGKQRAKAPVKVNYSGFGDEDDAWLSLGQLKNKRLGLTGEGGGKAAASKGKAKAKAKAEPVPDYSGMTKGLRMQVVADDGKYYAAEVVTVKEKGDCLPTRFVFCFFELFIILFQNHPTTMPKHDAPRIAASYPNRARIICKSCGIMPRSYPKHVPIICPKHDRIIPKSCPNHARVIKRTPKSCLRHCQVVTETYQK